MLLGADGKVGNQRAVGLTAGLFRPAGTHRLGSRQQGTNNVEKSLHFSTHVDQLLSKTGKVTVETCLSIGRGHVGLAQLIQDDAFVLVSSVHFDGVNVKVVQLQRKAVVFHQTKQDFNDGTNGNTELSPHRTKKRREGVRDCNVCRVLPLPGDGRRQKPQKVGRPNNALSF